MVDETDVSEGEERVGGQTEVAIKDRNWAMADDSESGVVHWDGS